MDEVCRLCCSRNFVNNPIFDEDGALYLKMSLYLPIKVFKNDRLPQKICDKCSCKVNDFYQFCNEAIAIQKRLQSALEDEKPVIDKNLIDLTRVKDNASPPPRHTSTQCTQTEDCTQYIEATVKEDRTIQTETTIKEDHILHTNATIKQEPDVKSENIYDDVDHNVENNVPSDDSDLYLDTLKKRKKKEKKGKERNGERKKRKKCHKDLENIVQCTLPEGTTITVLDTNGDDKEEVDLAIVKSEELGFFSLENDYEWRCCVCFVAGITRTQMLEHYKSHAEDVENHDHDRLPVITDGGLIKCSQCPRIFKERNSWSRHFMRHAPRPYRCALCEKTFREPREILRHGQTHSYNEGNTQPVTKRFVCDLCPQEFVYMRYLLEHRTSSHPEAQNRKLVNRCKQCGREFAHLNSLRRHQRTHTGERNHLCNVCGKALSSREHLKFHIRIHTGYKPNICKTCGKGFAKKCNLTLHERVHSGEKPHVCSHCGKAFSQRSTLVIHERYHSGARPYVCSLCGRGFVAKGLLSMHLKTTCI